MRMILSFYDVGPDKEEDREDLVRTQVEALLGLPLPFKRFSPQHMHEERWMSRHIYRIAVAVSMEFWLGMLQQRLRRHQQRKYTRLPSTRFSIPERVQRELAEAEAHMYTMKTLYDHVLDALPV